MHANWSVFMYFENLIMHKNGTHYTIYCKMLERNKRIPENSKNQSSFLGQQLMVTSVSKNLNSSNKL